MSMINSMNTMNSINSKTSMNSLNFYSHINSPIGDLLLLSDGVCLTGLYMDTGEHTPQADAELHDELPIFRQAKKQLDAYFSGARKHFDLPLKLVGTEFQKCVWSALLTIPYGAVTSYGQLAQAIGKEKAVRAVGLANGRNPVSIIVPCHRVIGSNGALTGYGGGLERKQFLLSLERGQKTLF